MQSRRDSDASSPCEKGDLKESVVSNIAVTVSDWKSHRLYQRLLAVLLITVAVFAITPAPAQTKDIPHAPSAVAVTTDAFSDSPSDAERDLRPLHYNHGFDYTRLWQAAAVLAAVLLGLILWNWKLAKEIKHRKNVEKALRESSEQFRVIQELLPDGFTILRPLRDAQGRVVDFTWVFQNAVVARLNGTDPQAVVGRRLLELFPGHCGSQFLNVYQRVAETGDSYVFEDCYQGETITNPTWFRIAVVPTGADIAILAQNITERKHAEALLQRTDRALRMISECNQVVVRANSEKDLLQSICDIVVNHGGFRMAWVGFAQSNEAKSVRPVAQAGFDVGYLDTVNITWADTERGRGPVGTSIRTQQIVIARNIPTDSTFDPWREAAIQRGYASLASLPLISGERAFGALSVYAADLDAFNGEEMSLLAELAGDLAYGITALRTRAAHKQTERAMNTSEARYRRLFETSKDGVLILNAATGRIVDANPFLAELLGYARDTFVGKHLWELGFFKDIAANETNFKELQAKDYICYDNLALETCDGRRIDVEFVSNAYMVDDHRVMQCNIRDISARKRSEAKMIASETRYRRLFESAKDGILILDAETGMVVDVNPFLIELLDYSREVFLGKKVWELGFFKNHIANETHFLELQTKKYIRYEDMALETRDGRRIEVEFISNVYLVDGQKVIQCNIRDISERVRTKENFNKFFEQPMGLNLIAKLDGVIQRANKGMEDLLGYDHGHLAGVNFLELVHPDDQAATIAEIAKLAQGINTLHFENRYRQKSGGFRRLAWSASVSTADQLVFAVATDITERKQTEEKLAASEKRHRAIIDGSPVPLALNNEQQHITYLNRAFVSVFGYTQEDVPTLADWWTKAYPDPQYRKIVADAWNAGLEKAKQTGNPFEPQEADVRCKDGTIKIILAVAAPLSEGIYEGENLAVLYDITERKQVEESHARLAMAVEQASETIIITDTQGTILYANPAFEKTTGYTCAEALGQNPRVLKSGSQDATFYRQMWDTLNRGEVWTGRFSNKRKDGTLFEEEATITPIRDAAGAVINFVAVKRDVTYEVNLESQLRQSQKMEAIGRLAGGIAHDFNNILAIIFGYSNLLQIELEENPEALAMIVEILKSGQRAKDLVQQILTFSQQREQERQVINLHPILKETMKLLRASLPTNYQIEMNLAADAPTVLADATQIYQVMMNLGTNALHAMEGMQTGRLTITLDAYQPDAAAINHQPILRAIKYARLTVSDTGCGMDAKTVERIYEPFFTTKPVSKGSGLGLAVVHGIVEANDAVITVESLPGRGTTFRVYFPEQVPGMLEEGIADDLVSCGQGESILMVDDEAALMGMCQKLLKVLKYEGTFVTNPKEAVRLVRENPAQFDVIITDLTMPEMSGLEVARQIREVRADLPIILATGFHGTVTDQQLRDAGICEVVEKPISMAALAMVLRRCLGGKTIQSQGTGISGSAALER